MENCSQKPVNDLMLPSGRQLNHSFPDPTRVRASKFHLDTLYALKQFNHLLTSCMCLSKSSFPLYSPNLDNFSMDFGILLAKFMLYRICLCWTFADQFSAWSRGGTWMPWSPSGTWVVYIRFGCNKTSTFGFRIFCWGGWGWGGWLIIVWVATASRTY